MTVDYLSTGTETTGQEGVFDVSNVAGDGEIIASNVSVTDSNTLDVEGNLTVAPEGTVSVAENATMNINDGGTVDVTQAETITTTSQSRQVAPWK